MQLQTDTTQRGSDGVLHEGKVVSTFCHRDDMQMLYDEREKAIGYVHLPTGQLFTLNGNHSYAKKPYPGPVSYTHLTLPTTSRV